MDVKERLSDQLKRSKESTVKDDSNKNKNSVTFSSNFQQLYFIFTESGKPVFNSDEFHDSYRLSVKQFNQALKSKTSLDSLKTTSINSLRLGNVTNIPNSNSNGLDYTSLMGVLNLIFNLVSIDGDELKFIKANNDLSIHFNKFDHLIYVYLSNLNESNKIINIRLSLLHEQVLSIIPKHHLNKILTTKPNYDLRQLVEGSEALLKNFIISLESSFHYNLQAIQPFRMDFKFRSHIGNLLLPPKHLRAHHLYTILFAYGKIITIVRPKKHSIHPTDLIIILNTVTSSPSLRNCESWLPVSLPKFTSNGFLNAYIAFVSPSSQVKESMDISGYPEIGVIHITGNPESFEDVSNWWYSTKQNMTDQGIFDRIYKSAPDSAYTCGDVSVPGLRHFIFKSKANVQITCPSYDSIYAQDMHARQRLLNSYDELYNRVHHPHTKTSASERRTAEPLQSPNPAGNKRDSTFTNRHSIAASGEGEDQDDAKTIRSVSKEHLSSSSLSHSTVQHEGVEGDQQTVSAEASRPEEAQTPHEGSNDTDGQTKKETDVASQSQNHTNEGQLDESNASIPTSSNHQQHNDTLTPPTHKTASRTLSQQLLRATISTPANVLKASTSMMSYMPSLPQFSATKSVESSQSPQSQKRQHTDQRSTQRTSHFIKNDHESVLVWSTRIFEVYVALPASMPHSAAVHSAQSVVKWIRKEEQNLFLGNTPTF